MRIRPGSSIPPQQQNLFQSNLTKNGAVGMSTKLARVQKVWTYRSHLTHQNLISFQTDRRCRLRVCQMSRLGNIYGEHELFLRLFLAPFHRGQQLVKYTEFYSQIQSCFCHSYDYMGIVYRHGEHTHGPTLENRPGGWD